MIDLRKEMTKLINTAFDTVIVRRKTNIKCNCWREESNTPDPRCHRCEGIGWVFEEFLHKCKFFLVDSQRVSHMQDYDFGKSYSNAFTVYMPVTKKSEKIKIDDHMFSVSIGLNGQVNKPIKRTRKWIITDCIPQHMDNGKLEFIQILAKPVDL